MKNNDKSDEYRIRAATVKKLLDEGWTRGDIRIEIPMSTASSGGRADIVCLRDGFLGCIELKSARDKLETDCLAVQLAQYERAFDQCAVIADVELYRRTEIRTHNGGRTDDNFRRVDLAFYHDYYRGGGVFRRDVQTHYGKEQYPVAEKITPILFEERRPWRRTSVYDMACVLWADELRQIFGSKGTKSGLEQKAREEMSVAQFRPLMIQALRERPMNEWETAFWKKFDAAA